MIPAEIHRLLNERLNAGWSGKLTLNFKDGRILDVECAEKIRLASRDRSEPASANAGGSPLGIRNP